MPPQRNVLGAMFDIRPVKAPGVLDFEKIARVTLELNLKSDTEPETIKKQEILSDTFKRPSPALISANIHRPRQQGGFKRKAQMSQYQPVKLSKEDLLRELEGYVAGEMNTSAEVIRLGGNINLNNYNQRIDLAGWDADDFVRLVVSGQLNIPLAQTHTLVQSNNNDLLPSGALDSQIEDGSQHSPEEDQQINEEINEVKSLPAVSYQDSSSHEEESIGQSANNEESLILEENIPATEDIPTQVEESLVKFYDARKPDAVLSFAGHVRSTYKKSLGSSKRSKSKKSTFGLKMVLVLAICGIALWLWSYFSKGEGTIKNNIIQNGKNAVSNLVDARDNLEKFKFAEAVDNFTLAYDDFDKAGNTLDKIGASLAPILNYIPGLDKISSAVNMVLVGRNVSSVGRDLSLALDVLSHVPAASFLGNESNLSIHNLLKTFDDVISSSKKRIAQTEKLLAKIDVSLLPEDKKELFTLFRNRLPELTDFLVKADNYAGVLADLIPDSGEVRYLLLFQNNTELRANGGFVGSYALITFKDGILKEIKVDDSYNPDGQLRDKIIPPQPLQHITPNWGMRDANWFADFPTSAQKVIDFYQKSTGIRADGVFTMTPDIITDILAVVGPIEMSEYNINLDQYNFLPEVQDEVEYGESKAEGRPKKILSEFMPKFLDKISQQEKDGVVKIFEIIKKSLNEKKILAYFNYKEAQKIAIESGIAGEIKTSDSDYLQVVFSNIKGFKTDFVTDSSIKLSGEIKSSEMNNTLEISRTHKGGDSDYKFYNQINADYVRVYIPAHAQLESVSGYSRVNNSPLVDYGNSVFVKDKDLSVIEASRTSPIDGVDEFMESGKKVIGFWMNISPKTSKKVIVKYRVPLAYIDERYKLLIQKQSGTGAISLDVSITFPDDKAVKNYLPGDLQLSGNKLTFKSDLSVDREINIETN